MAASKTAIYGELPSSADQAAVKAFTVHIAEEEVERMKALVKLSRVAGASYENSLPDGSRTLGLRREWLLRAKETWENDFDWRQHEGRINAFPHFRAQVPFSDSTIGIHFVGLFSQNPAATPLVLLHGWPGSFLEFLPILEILKQRYPDPKELPYHVIVPSLPGYCLSDAPPVDRNFNYEDATKVIDTLLVRVLGLTRYVAQGGDVGSRIARFLAARYEHCRGALLNFSPIPQPEGAPKDDLPEHEKKGLERLEWFTSKGTAYSLMQATRPGTIGLVLSSSPLAVLAYVGEKFLDWSDPASFPANAQLPETQVSYSKEFMDEILVSASLYWLTDRAHTNIYTYRDSTIATTTGKGGHHSPENVVREPKKLGYSYFPLEIMPMPRAWVETTGDLVYWKVHDKGGHFAALEQPELLLADIDEFIAKNIKV